MEAKQKKSKYEKLEKKLKYERKLGWEEWSKQKIDRSYKYAEGYKQFLDQAKTERQAVKWAAKTLEKAGFVEVGEALSPKSKAKAKAKKVYMVVHGQAVIAADMTGAKLLDGTALVFSHVDSPRLDLKPVSLYESGDMAFLKTHYYGGIKKYLWAALPLALYAHVVTEDGKQIEFSIGDGADDPQFLITDLAIHLSKKLMEKKAKEVVEGEKLNVLVGSRAVSDKEVKEKVKLWVLEHLDKEYKIKEEDLISADIQVVPAGLARDIGFDRSMILGYGHDDRSCSFAAMTAMLDAKKVNTKKKGKVAVGLCEDKEETGSEGITGVKAEYVKMFYNHLMELSGMDVSEYNLRKIFENSKGLSADTDALDDPHYLEAVDEKNSAKLGRGVVLTRYTGHGGKYVTNDALAGYVAEIRQVFNKQKVLWQPGLLGKIDEGGGGTIAMYIASYGVPVIDCGVGVLSLHSPYEVVSKIDLYATYEAYRAFFEMS